MRLIFLGPPGAGKGTHAKILSNRFGIPHISTGDILRARIHDGSEIGRKAKSYVESGGLVPDAVVIQMVKERLEEHDTERGFIFDGFPRTLGQAESFQSVLSQLGLSLDMAVNFNVSVPTIISRLTGRRVCPKCNANYHIVNMPPKKEGLCDSCGVPLIQRKDDEEGTIRKRLSVYEQDTAPLIAHYRKRGLLKEIDANLEVKELDSQLQKILKTVSIS